jgi:hypothetical protein
LSVRLSSVRAVTVIADRVVGLRQYTLVPDRRDELIELFDRELIETQEKCGMRILGQFRDLDEPDQFVWLRSFVDLPLQPRPPVGAAPTDRTYSIDVYAVPVVQRLRLAPIGRSMLR